MFLLTLASVFILPVFGSQGTSGCEEEVCPAHQNEPWSYGGVNGPPNWGNSEPQCNGKSQSPINIKKVVRNRELILNRINYDIPITSATVENNGHTIQVTPTDDVSRAIEVDGTSGSFLFTQLHFHWGSKVGCGSEHQIDGKSKELELHLVHRSSEGRLAVIGVLYKNYPRNNPALNPIVESLHSVQYKDQQTSLQSQLVLNELLPWSKSYYRYNGSLTTPPCSENVIWSVFEECQYIGSEQLEEFRKLYSTSENEDQCYLVNNVRPEQLLNGRTVYYFQATRKGKK